MDFLSSDFFSALLAIVVIDLVLAGDNAIVIALAARSLPRELQRKAIGWGTLGAIGVRTVMTLAVVWLLKLPGLLLVGGLLLIPIALKLLVNDKHPDSPGAKPIDNFWAAMRTIIVADALMGLDNVLAVAGAAGGSFLLVVLGLLISVPIMVWGSTLILRLVERFPSVIYLGAGALLWTSAKMILHEGFVAKLVTGRPVLAIGFQVFVIAGVLALGWWRDRAAHPKA
ncbi:MAG: TerC family protein [Tahibacter sp.]